MWEVSKMAKKMDRENITMGMAGCGKESGKTTDKMGTASLPTSKVRKYKATGLTVSKARPKLVNDENNLILPE